MIKVIIPVFLAVAATSSDTRSLPAYKPSVASFTMREWIDPAVATFDGSRPLTRTSSCSTCFPFSREAVTPLSSTQMSFDELAYVQSIPVSQPVSDYHSIITLRTSMSHPLPTVASDDAKSPVADTHVSSPAIPAGVSGTSPSRSGPKAWMSTILEIMEVLRWPFDTVLTLYHIRMTLRIVGS